MRFCLVRVRLCTTHHHHPPSPPHHRRGLSVAITSRVALAKNIADAQQLVSLAHKGIVPAGIVPGGGLSTLRARTVRLSLRFCAEIARSRVGAAVVSWFLLRRPLL